MLDWDIGFFIVHFQLSAAYRRVKNLWELWHKRIIKYTGSRKQCSLECIFSSLKIVQCNFATVGILWSILWFSFVEDVCKERTVLQVNSATEIKKLTDIMCLSLTSRFVQISTVDTTTNDHLEQEQEASQ